MRPPLTASALEADPYPAWTWLRRHEPVAWSDELALWLVTRWDDVCAIDRDDQRFRSRTVPSTIDDTIGPNMLRMDGADHARIRSAVAPAFQPRTIRAAGADFVGDLTAELIDGFAAAGRAELVSALTEPLAVRVLQRVLGVDEVPEARFREWVSGISDGAGNFEGDPVKAARAEAASRDVDAVLTPLLHRLEAAPDASVLSSLLSAGLEEAKILSTFKLFVIGGVQESRDLLGLTLWALLTHPEQLTAVRDEPRGWRRAVEETLRWQAPVGTITRQVAAPTTVAGTRLPAGALVAGVIGSANRDERRWEDPDRFDIHRNEGGHAAFAVGAHVCVGAWLARHQTVEALEAVFARLPRITLDHAEVRGYEFRGPTKLICHW